MRLYEIPMELEAALMAAIDSETGEVIDKLAFAELGQLEGELETKALNIACLIKSYKAEMDALKAEAKALTTRAGQASSKVDSLKRYLSTYIPDGVKYADSRAKIGWSKSTRVIVQDEVDCAKLPTNLRKIEHKPIATEIKKVIMAYHKQQGNLPVKNDFKTFEHPLIKGLIVKEVNNLQVG